MTAKKILTQTIGLAQTVIGSLIIIFGFGVFYNFNDVQLILNLSQNSAGMYLWIITLLGMLSAISGLILFFEK